LPAAEPTPARPLSTIWEIPDDLWEEIEPIIDCFYPPARTGRLRADLVHGWFQRFSADGFLEELWAYLVRECDEFGEVHWEWQAVDGVMGKSRFGGKKTGPNPTDRAKMGTKKSVQVARRPSGGQDGALLWYAGLEDGVFPHSRAIDEGGLEEERRLFYRRRHQRLQAAFGRFLRCGDPASGSVSQPWRRNAGLRAQRSA
jgi:hypothetical protein